MPDIPELAERMGKLETEVKYLKWIIPAACGFVALVVLVFWGIERKHIGERVSSALDAEGVSSALEKIDAARIAAEEGKDITVSVKEAADLAYKNMLAGVSFASIPVLSVDHKKQQGVFGTYFNFDNEAVDAALGHSKWHGRKFGALHSRLGRAGKVILWRDSNSGSEGAGAGRYDDKSAKPGEWEVGDFVILLLPK